MFVCGDLGDLEQDVHLPCDPWSECVVGGSEDELEWLPRCLSSKPDELRESGSDSEFDECMPCYEFLNEDKELPSLEESSSDEDPEVGIAVAGGSEGGSDSDCNKCMPCFALFNEPQLHSGSHPKGCACSVDSDNYEDGNGYDEGV